VFQDEKWCGRGGDREKRTNVEKAEVKSEVNHLLKISKKKHRKPKLTKLSCD
jgi:hypothetical protein